MRAWLVRAGRAGEREQWALSEGCTGGGFRGVPDLSTADDRAEVLAEILRGLGPVPANRARNFTAQLWALRGRMAVADLVVMPLKATPHLAIGRITGDYRYAAEEPDRTKRHRRPVEWLTADVPRPLVGQDLLYSLGASSTICEMSRNDAARRLHDLMHGRPDPGPA